MSFTLYWEPAPELESYRDLPTELKGAISQRFWNHDGSLKGEVVYLTDKHSSYFQGLVDGGTPGAIDIVNAIYTHGRIAIYIDE